MSDVFADTADARSIDFSALGVAMSGMRGGFSEAGPMRSAGVEPKHFSPANPGTNPTAGWDPFDPLADPAPEPDSPLVAAEAARAEGFAEGMAAAERVAAARNDVDAKALAEIAGLLELMSGFDRDALAARLRQTVMTLVTQVVGEVGVAPDRLNQRIDAAIALLADHSEVAQLRLNPADLALVEGHQPAHVTLVGDEAIGRGGFRIETRSTSVEDGPESWLAQLATAMDRVALPGA